MKLKLSRVALTTMSLLPLLTACGGSDNKDDQPKEKTLEVTAIDGYLQNALVWLDVNGDGLPDTTNEPNARTGADGKATLDVSAVTNPGQYRLLVKAIANETVDLERGTVTRDYTMSAPAGVSVVTPLSTLVDLKMQQDPSLTAPQPPARWRAIWGWIMSGCWVILLPATRPRCRYMRST